jgi:assimilatory nitrate reductase catalytic subunit
LLAKIKLSFGPFVYCVGPRANFKLIRAWEVVMTVAVDRKAQDWTVTETHCPYCALQCGMSLTVNGKATEVNPNPRFPVNKGSLCIKGWTATEALSHPERLKTPLARNRLGQLEPASWETALNRIAYAFRAAQLKYGPDAVGVFGSGALTNEKAYLLGKFARVALRSSSIDYNGRYCMSSAAAASNKAFGLDRGLPFPLEDIERAEVILLVGSNVAETMPPFMQYFEAQRNNGGKLIAVDPRLSVTSQQAFLHLRVTPGTDAALANGILHILVRDGLIDERYIAQRTEGFEAVKGACATYWPARVEQITGVPEAQLAQAAHLVGSAKTAMILTGRGAEQQSQGVTNVLSFINIALALGLVGKPYSGYGCLTGQGNGQGGREHGQKADQLPGYRLITNEAARKHIADVWGVKEEELPLQGKSAYELLDSCGQEDGARALFVMGSNVLVSSPRSAHIEGRLQSLDFLAVADFFLSETAQLADVVLPSAQWAEEEGTMTNLEGRVILRRRAIDPPPEVKTDVEILCDLARKLGRHRGFSFANAEEVFEELRQATEGAPADYSGISYEKIERQQGVFWPCPSDDHTGTPRLFRDKFYTPNGRARFHAVRHLGSAETPDAEYPLYLTTGRVLAQYQSGAQTRRIEKLNELSPEPYAEIHPSTARIYGIRNDEKVLLRTRRNAIELKVKISTSIREDTVFAPFHWGEDKCVNRLTNPALDPTSGMPEFKVCAVRIEKTYAVIHKGKNK